MGDNPAPPPSQGPPPFHVAIIGGGITGINLALGLRARGVPFTLYERAPAFGEIGAGIGFSPNAEVAMNLLSPEILSAFKRVANPNGEDWFQFADGYSGGDGLMYKLYVGEEGFQGCRRSDILEEWARLLPEEGVVKFGRKVVSATELGEGGVELLFKGGEREMASVVVACDGIRSRVRAGLFPGSPATFTGKECYRALVPMESAVEAIGEKKAGTRWMYLGREGHVITYPVGGNTLLNVVCWVWSGLGRLGWLLTWNDSSLSCPRRTPGPTRQSTRRPDPGARSMTPLSLGLGAQRSGPSPASCRKPWTSGASST